MKEYYSLSAKQLGIILIGIALLLSVLFISYTRELTQVSDSACVCSDAGTGTCPHEGGFPLQSYLGFTLAFVLGGLGAFMVFNGMKLQEAVTEKEKKAEKVLIGLAGDEKSIGDLIKEGGGAVFQSELVEKSGLTKVKVSRVLDKLEGKGIIERRRRGMTNLVILK